jgi:hypothetical protein
MTLVDLRAGRNPFDRRNVRARQRWQVGLSLATLLLIAIIAYYQYLVQRQESALRAYKEVVEARGSERIIEVRNLVQVGRALAKDSCQRDRYQKARHELRQLAGKTAVASLTLFRLSEQSAWPLVDWLTEFGEAVADRMVKPAMASGPASERSDTDTSTAAGPPPGSDWIPDPCDESQRTRIIPAGYPDWLRNVVLDSIDEFCFASKLNIDTLSSTDPLRQGNASYFGPGSADVDPVARVEQRTRVQTGWLLPFLYGLLGACVYVMRRLLFDTKTAVVENVVIVLRLALGALAGVAMGWFASPSTLPYASAPASSLPYAFAFLAGFSIDILFTLLDRLNRALLDKTQAVAP